MDFLDEVAEYSDELKRGLILFGIVAGLAGLVCVVLYFEVDLDFSFLRTMS